jgi:hypothetical protein
MRRALSGALLLLWLGSACVTRPRAMARGIELEDPNDPASSVADAGSAGDPNSALVASGNEPPGAAPGERDDARFVYSRQPPNERQQASAQLPIHINERWWPFRASHLGITEREAQRRDAAITDVRAPADFWDAQSAVEAASVWTVFCNECHGGRRSIEDALEMPAPAPGWSAGSGLFFGNRRSYSQLFKVVYDGGPLNEDRRVGMPAWRNVLSNEMIWALLYFLEYQSGGIESRFPPSLYPRRPKMLGAQ